MSSLLQNQKEDNAVVQQQEQEQTTTSVVRQRVSLNGYQNLFFQALDRYIDENKPNPMSLRQIQSWNIQWNDSILKSERDEKQKEEKEKEDNVNVHVNNSVVVDDEELFNDVLTFQPDYFIHGILSIGGEYLIVQLTIFCTWKTNPKNTTSTTKQQPAPSSSSPYGSLYYTCHANARFWTKSELSNNTRFGKSLNEWNNNDYNDDDDNDNDNDDAMEEEKDDDNTNANNNKNNDNKKNKRIQDKIRSKMTVRLQQDDYISKLLLQKDSSSSLPGKEKHKSNKNKNNKKSKDDTNDKAKDAVSSASSSSSLVKKSSLVAQAKILNTEEELQERVVVSEDTCIGIQRSIWNLSESPLLDVIEMILQFPSLPTTVHSTSSFSNDSTTTNTTNKETTTTTSSSSSSSSNGGNTNKTLFVTTSLANRAKLRLLEDAMIDACEQEGEDEIIQELKISPTTTTNTTTNDDDDNTNNNKSHQQQQHQRGGGRGRGSGPRKKRAKA